MSATITAKEVGEAWTRFVTDVFMIDNGCGRPEVDEELRRLEESGELKEAREDGRAATDTLIDEILRGTPESRRELFARADCASLALVYDRVKCGTQILTGIVQQGVEMKSEGMPSLPDLFRQMLLQKL